MAGRLIASPENRVISADARRKHQLEMLLVLVLILLSYAVYSRALGYDFVNFDDDVLVYENSRVQRGLTWEGLVWTVTTTHSGHWHPVTWLSHMLDCELYGLNAGGHHLSNLLIHMLNAVLLFKVLRKLTGRLWESAFVGALFAVHPLNVESVAWVAERKNVLSTSFWFLTMWAYASYVEQPGVGRYLLVVFSFVLGLMTKSMLVTLPFVLLLLDYWPLGRVRVNGMRRLVWEKLPLFVLSAAASGMAYHAASSVGAVHSSELYPIGMRVGNAVMAYANYIGKMVWPMDLTVFYPHPGVWPLRMVAFAGFMLVAMTLLAIRLRNRHPYLIVGWLWFLGTLVPVIGLVQAGSQGVADRYAYVPLVGLFMVVGWTGGSVSVAWGRKGLVIVAAMAGMVPALAFAARSATVPWENGVSLFQRTVSVTVHNHLAHNNLGEALVAQGRPEEAIPHYWTALRIAPHYADVYYHNIGIALARKGNHAEAISHYREALRVRPAFVDAHINLGLSLADIGDTEQAVTHVRRAIEIKPQHAKAHFILGVLLVRKDKLQDAEMEWREAVRLEPNMVEAYLSLAHVLEQQGRLEEAIAAYRQGIRVRPELEQARFAVGLAYLKNGDKSSALKEHGILMRNGSSLAEPLLRKIEE